MIYLFLTTTLTPVQPSWGPTDYPGRQMRYLRCIKQTLDYLKDTDIKPIIIVNDNGVTRSYLDDFDCDIVYTSNNRTDTIHKGKCEMDSIQYAIQHYNIGDGDMIIKQTGRYCPCSDYFYKLVMEKCTTHDVLAKFYNVATYCFDKNDCVMGLIAIRCKYLRKFQYKLVNTLSPECELAVYMRDYIPSERIYEVEDLSIEYCHGVNPDALDYY